MYSNCRKILLAQCTVISACVQIPVLTLRFSNSSTRSSVRLAMGHRSRREALQTALPIHSGLGPGGARASPQRLSGGLGATEAGTSSTPRPSRTAPATPSRGPEAPTVGGNPPRDPRGRRRSPCAPTVEPVLAQDSPGAGSGDYATSQPPQARRPGHRAVVAMVGVPHTGTPRPPPHAALPLPLPGRAPSPVPPRLTQARGRSRPFPPWLAGPRRGRGDPRKGRGRRPQTHARTRSRALRLRVGPRDAHPESPPVKQQDVKKKKMFLVGWGRGGWLSGF